MAGAAERDGPAAPPASGLRTLTDRLVELAPPTLGIAVSGGSDSTALLLAAARAPGLRVEAATVDHRLRPEAAAEARAVAALCARLDLPHETLVWHDAPGRGNLAQAARDARAALLADWAARRGLGAVALGHTLDDQAETLLMRLARGSGLDGLSAMRPRSERAGAVWLRPALSLRREALRAALRAEGEGWIDDPSNDDRSRDRIRTRDALKTLAALGIDAQGLGAAAERLAEDADLLAAQAAALIREAARIGGAGELRLRRSAWRDAPPPIRRRALARLMQALSGDAHAPRHAALASLDIALADAAPMPARSLAGVLASSESADGDVILHREPAAAPPPTRGLWDRRWRLGDAGEIGALGEDGLAELRALDLPSPVAWAAAPRAARVVAPGLRCAGRLVAAPLAGLGPPAEDRLAQALDLAPAPSGHAPSR